MIDPHSAAEDLMEHSLPREQAERFAFVAWWIDRVGPITHAQLLVFLDPVFTEEQTEGLADIFWIISRKRWL